MVSKHTSVISGNSTVVASSASSDSSSKSAALTGLGNFGRLTQGGVHVVHLPWAIFFQPYRLLICVNSCNSCQNFCVPCVPLRQKISRGSHISRLISKAISQFSHPPPA